MSVYKGENVIAGGSVDTYFVRKPAWSRAVAISAADLVAGYEAPSDGLIIGWSEPATNRAFNVLINNSITVASCHYASSRSTISTPINKGDVIKATAEPGWNNVEFVPFEDSTIAEPEVVTPEYIRNQNILSDYENVTLPFIAQYDGELVVNTTTNSGLILAVNGAQIVTAVYSQGTSVGNSASITIKKGDVISTNNNYQSARARYYKLRDYRGR